MEKLTAIERLASLAQETRLSIFRLLVRATPAGLPAGELAAAAGVPAPTMSFHLSHLRNAGLVRRERRGRTILYTVDMKGARELVAFLVEDCCQGRPELCGVQTADLCSVAEKTSCKNPN
jgi:ArsR family transcriptional regulator, arsenate/arsenite/antimonite-responsive transcriptional repressor